MIFANFRFVILGFVAMTFAVTLAYLRCSLELAGSSLAGGWKFPKGGFKGVGDGCEGWGEGRHTRYQGEKNAKNVQGVHGNT